MIQGEMKTATVAERPDLVEPAWQKTRDTLPEYNNHGDVLNVYWGRLSEERPEFQFDLVDDADDVLARARSIPLRWGRSRICPRASTGRSHAASTRATRTCSARS